MKLSIKAFALASGLIWAAAVLVTGVINLNSPGYGEHFLNMVSSIYPGYDVSPAMASVLIGTAYAFVDGLVGGVVFSWLYNKLSS